MARLLGVDLGTTTFKAMVFDESGNVLSSAHVRPPDDAMSVDGVRVDYWDPGRLWETFSSLVRRVVDQLPDPHVDAVALVEVGLIGMPVDPAGRPRFPAVAWIDVNPALSNIFATTGLRSEDVFAVTGNTLNPIYPPAWIRWLSERVPDYLTEGSRWVYYGDWLAWRLTGTLAIDRSMASGTLTLDQSTLSYREDLQAAFGLPRGVFPEPQPAGSVIGGVTPEASSATGLPEGTTVVLGGGDYLSGPFGAGFVDAGDVAINTGSWECVVICSAGPRLDPRLAAVGAICDPHVVRDRWTIRIENLVGTVTEWFRREVARFDSPELAEDDRAWSILVERAESSAPGAGGLAFLPYVFGSYGPRLDEYARGAFVGLRSTTTQADFARALFEGLNFHTRSALEAMLLGSGETPGRIVCMGGGTRNRFWMQNRADVLGREIEVTESPDVTARGAAMTAGIGAGIFDGPADAVRHLSPARYVISPDPERSGFYARRYEDVFVPLLDALAPIHYELRDRSS